MSGGAGKSQDVEDVLSSIRRLVSEPGAASQQSAGTIGDVDATSTAAGDNSAGPDALILTSSFRVDLPAQEAEGADERVSNLESLRKAVSGTVPGQDDVVADHAHHSEVVSEAWPASDPDEYYEDEPTDTKSAEWVRSLRGGESNSEKRAFPDAVEAPVEGERAAFGGASVDTADAQSETSVELAEAADQPDVADASDASIEAVEAVEWEDIPEETPLNFGDDGAFADVDELDRDEPSHDETIARGDEASAETSGSSSLVEDLGVATFVRSNLDGGDDAEQVTGEFADPTAVEERANAFADIDGLGDVGIDEDILRDMVADIVRQELSGELGERITRNVRKLVRREIHRTLLTREFE